MTDISFGTAPAPAVRSGRVGEPNPFSDKFPTPVDESGKAQALTVTLKGSKKDNAATLTKLTGQARRAAAALDTPMTARIQSEQTGTGKNVQTVLYVWTVDKITRKGDETADAEATPAE